MNGRCAICNELLMTGDYGNLCGKCKRELNNDLQNDMIPKKIFFSEVSFIDEKVLIELAKRLKPYLDSIENCEVCKK